LRISLDFNRNCGIVVAMVDDREMVKFFLHLLYAEKVIDYVELQKSIEAFEKLFDKLV